MKCDEREKFMVPDPDVVATGARVVFNYNSDLTKLISITANKRNTSFAYDAAGHLTKITYPDGKSSTFGYNGDQLIWAQNPDKRRITYGYRTDCGVERIAKIGEGYTDTAGTFHKGTEIEVTYPELGTTVFTEPGLDGELSSIADNHVYTWKFNRYGSPVEISDNAGHVNTFSLYEDGAKRHHIGVRNRQQQVLLRLRYSLCTMPKASHFCFDSMERQTISICIMVLEMLLD